MTDAPRTERRWGIRSIAALLIFVLAALLTPIALVGHWGHRTLVDTERYLETVGPLIEQPEVQEAIAASITQATVQAIDTEAQVEGLLNQLFPDASFTGPLAGPISAGINSLVGELVTRFVQSDQFANAWIQLNRAVQRSVVTLLEGGEEGPLRVQGDDIVLDVSSLLATIQQYLVESGLTAAGNITLPESDRQIVITTVDGLGQVRFMYSLASPVLAWFPLVIAALFALSVALARRRARIVVALGVVLLAEALLLGLSLQAGQEQFENQLVGTPWEPASAVFWDTLLNYLIIGVRAVIWLGAVLILAGWFGGRTRAARFVRTPIVRGLDELGDRLPSGLQPLRAAVSRFATPIRWAIYGVLGLFLVLGDLASPTGVLWVTALAAGLITAVQVLVDVPDASGAPADGASSDSVSVTPVSGEATTR